MREENDGFEVFPYNIQPHRHCDRAKTAPNYSRKSLGSVHHLPYCTVVLAFGDVNLKTISAKVTPDFIFDGQIGGNRCLIGSAGNSNGFVFTYSRCRS